MLLSGDANAQAPDAVAASAKAGQSVQLPILRPRAVALVRDALAALNHANWTGNYTVLRDYASPNFAAANDAAKLAAIFGPARSARIDFFPAMVLEPVFTRGALVENGRLLLIGYFELDPTPVRFDLLFEPVDRRWRLFGIAVNEVEPQQPAQSTVQAPTPTPRPDTGQ